MTDRPHDVLNLPAVHEALLTLAREARRIEFIWIEGEIPGRYCPACGGSEHAADCAFGRALAVLVDHLPRKFWMPPRSHEP